MEIIVELRWSPLYLAGGYYRWNVSYSDGKKRIVLQHREIMETFLGRKLLRSEHVHHIDECKTNNDLANLELLSSSDHSRKHARVAECVDLICMRCKSSFRRPTRKVRSNRKQGNNSVFCSRACSAANWMDVGHALTRKSKDASGQLVHGLDITYKHRGCRCVACKQAHCDKQNGYNRGKSGQKLQAVTKDGATNVPDSILLAPMK